MNFSSLFRVTFLSLIVLVATNCRSKDSGAGPTVVKGELSPGDTLRIKFFDEPNLFMEVEISRIGEVDLLLVGPVKIAGLSIAAATEKIHDRYSENYLKNPRISIIVIPKGAPHIAVSGAVEYPGKVPLPKEGDFSFADALAFCGGVTNEDFEYQFELTRAGNQALIGADELAGIFVEAGDVIVVSDGRPHVVVLGAVPSPGRVIMPLNGRLDLVTALAACGGGDLKAPDSIESLRFELTRGDKKYRLQGQEAFEFNLRDDDVIEVIERK
ncbi:polysaccharide biosynthesis/export family protein [Verrucomicrobiaceae bacterium 227]